MSGPALVLLIGFLGVSVLTDIRDRKIPNLVVATGTALAAGIALQHGQAVWWDAVGGWAVGVGMLMPLYLLRGMSAGDVKLMGMVGAFLGLHGVVAATLYAVVAGGILALIWRFACRQRPEAISRRVGTLASRQTYMAHAQIDGDALINAPRHGIPYAVAIAAGAGFYIVTNDLISFQFSV